MPNEKQTPRPATSLAEMLKTDSEAGLPDSPDNEPGSQISPIAVVADDADASEADDSASDDSEEAGIDDDDNATALVFVHQPKCLGCGHLVGFAEKKYKSCHFTAGNEMCPAQSIKIAIQLDTKRIVMNFLNAEEEGDTEKLSRLYAALATKPDWGRRQILDDLAAARSLKTKR